MDFFLWQVFITLLVVIDPFAVVPLFLGLTAKDNAEVKRKIALKACTIATIILLLFAFVGDYLLDAMSISEPAFRIAGSFLLLLTAIDMVVAKSHSGLHSTTIEEEKEASKRDDVSVFPLAIPMIAGPGTLTSIIVLMRQAEVMPHNVYLSFGIIFIAVGVIILTYFCMLTSGRLMKILGVTGTNVLTRVFGIILTALATQGIINGILLVAKTFNAT